MLASLAELTEDQLITVLTEPKNAVTRQFQALFSLNNVSLEFTPDALRAVAARSRKRKTGARGLRGVIEANLQNDAVRPARHGQGRVSKIVITAR